MQKAHVQVLPSFFEGLPLVLFEGLASGCRIITTQLSGFDEIFGNAKNDTVDLIQLRPLESIDRPYQKDSMNQKRPIAKMKLRYDPYQVFRNSHTPAGLYARQKWLEEADTPGWQTAFQKVVKKLLADQMPDGSWQHAPMATISALFGLHLTLRSADGRIENALNWLSNKMQRKIKGIGTRSTSDVGYADLKGLPFVPGDTDMLLTGATLFLCSIFERQSDSGVLAVYERFDGDGLIKESLARDIVSMHNIFRALVVHPEFAHKALAAEAVAMYAGLQNEDGDWGNRLPFYQTVNALAHLNSPEAEAQLESAFSRLFETQNKDGTWGRDELEWNTFLCIHALKNKEIL